MKSSFVAVFLILLYGDTLEQSAANILEDVTVDVDDKYSKDSKKDAKEIRTVDEGALVLFN